MAGLAREHAQAVRLARRTRHRRSSRCSRAFPTPSLFARPIIITNADFRFVVAEQLREQRHRGRHRARADAPRFRARGRGRRRARGRTRSARRSCWCWPPTTSSASPTNSAKPAGARPRPRPRGGSSPSASSPRYPATNYGYIRPGEKLNGSHVHAVEAFVEKPDAATAATYVADRYLWNSGNFLFHAATMLAEIERFEPAMAEAAKAAVAGLTRDLDFLRLARRAVRPRAEEIDRLRRHGAHQARRRGSRRSRLVRCRQLERGLGHPRSRRRRQCHRWSGRHAGQPQQPGALGRSPC